MFIDLRRYLAIVRTIRSGALFVPLLLGIFLTGCGALPISGPSESPLAGKKVTEQEMASVAAVGKSRKEVIADLGNPTIELNDLRILVYPWIEHKGDWLLFAFSYTGGVAVTTPRQEDWALLVAFDDKDRVTDTGLVKKKPSDSINTTARTWAEARGVDIPPPSPSFSLLSVPTDKALVYVFRAKPPISWKTVLGAGSWPWPVAIAVDGQYISEMHNETYVTLSIQPGKHEFLADALPSYRYVPRGSLVISSDKRQPASITLDTQPNQVYFIRLLCTSGTGTIDSTLTPQTEVEALQVLKEFRPAW